MLSKQSFLKTSIIISLAVLASKVLGLVRQQYSIYLFGGGWEFDSFIAAFRIPNALRELLAEGALSAAFIPLFSAILLRRGKAEAFSFANKVISLAIIITVFIAFIGYISSDIFISYYHNNPEHINSSVMASELLSVIMFYLPFISLSALAMGMLNSMDKFTIPALGPFFSNIAFLVILYFSHKIFGIQALAYSIIVGGLAYLVIQIPLLVRSGFRFRFTINFKDEHIKEFLALFIPFAMAMGIPKLNNILSNIFSGEITGANTALAQGFFVIQLPLSVFISGISTVSLPNLAKYFDSGKRDSFKSLIAIGLRMVLLITVPSAFGIMILDYEISRLIFSDILLLFSEDSGKINDTLIRNIGIAQFYFAPAIISMGASVIFLRAFQSMKDMKTMIYTGLSSVILNFILMMVLVKFWSFRGIAFSIMLSSFFNFALLVIVFVIKVGDINFKTSIFNFIRILLKAFSGSVIMLLVIYFLRLIIEDIAITSIYYVDNIIKTIILIVFGGISYVLSLLLFREEEVLSIFNHLVKRLRRT